MGVVAFEAPDANAAERPLYNEARTGDGPKRKYGLIPALPGAQFVIPIARAGRPRNESVTCKDRRNFPGVAVKYFCLHPACKGKSWDDIPAMVKDENHASASDLQRDEQTHVYFAYSPERVSNFDPNCPDCQKASAKALAEARKTAPDAEPVDAPCSKHIGGVIGMLSPADPNVLS